MKKISAKKLKCLISKKKEFSLLDIREIGRHSKGHPFFSVSIPFSVFESRIEKLVPNKNVPIILIDDNDGLSEIVVACS